MLTDTAAPQTPCGVFVVPVSDARKGESPRRGRRRRLLRNLFMVFALVLGVFVGGVGATGSTTVQANPFDFFCSYTDPPDVIEEKNPGDNKFYTWPGSAGQLAQITNNASYVGVMGGAVSGWIAGDNSLDTTQQYPPGQPITAYEWYGTAGLSWTSANYKDVAGSCGVEGIFARGAANILSGIIWGLVATLGSFGLLLYYYAAAPNALAPFLGEDGPVDTLLSNSLDGLFLVFLAPIIVLTAIYFAYAGLVKRRSSETIQGVIWMIGASAAAIFLFSNPLTVPTFINNTVSQVQALTLNVITASTAGGGGNGALCYLPPEAPPGNNLTPDQQAQIAEANRFRTIRISQCVQWQIFLYQPWAVGQFGDLASVPLDGADSVAINGRTLQASGNSAVDPGTAMSLVHLDAVTINHDQAIAGGLTAAERAQKISQRQLIYDYMKELWNVAPGQATSSQIGAVETWTGGDRVVRLGAAFLALISMILAAGPILLLTFSLLLYQLGTLFLLLLAPVFLTLGINPGWGRRIALGWLEQIINLSIKRIGTTVLIAILLAVIQAIVFAGGAWIVQIFLISATGIGMLTFRGRILSMLASVNLGGTNAIDVEEATSRGAKLAGGVATGAVVGGGMAMAGGAGASAVMKSAMSGAGAGMSGKSTTAAVVGYGTAHQAIDRANDKKDREAEKEQKEEERKANRSAAQQYEALMEELDNPNSGLTQEEIKGIREIRRNLGAEEGLLKADLVRKRADERRIEQAAQLQREEEERARLIEEDPIVRADELTEEQRRINAENERRMAEELAQMQSEDRAMAMSGGAEHAYMWINHYRGVTPNSGDGGRPIPRPKNPELEQALIDAGVPLRDWLNEPAPDPEPSPNGNDNNGEGA